MSSSICQGLQSCLEPRLSEPQVLNLKLTPSKSTSSRSAAVESSENGGWSFLQAPSSTDNNVYIHPLTKQSSAALTEKSLAMCTESLGSETGSETGGDDGMSLFPADGKIARASKKIAKARISIFPPPLTSISGPIGIKVKPHREGGRLILEAVSFPGVKPCFEVERGGGRLRLRLLERSGEFDEEEEREEGGEREEEREGSNENGGVGKQVRLSRCKDGGGGRKGLMNWEPFLVST